MIMTIMLLKTNTHFSIHERSEVCLYYFTLFAGFSTSISHLASALRCIMTPHWFYRSREPTHGFFIEVA